MIRASRNVVDVFHHRRFYESQFGPNPPATYMGDLIRVAHVSFAKDMETEDALERAFATTQNLDYSWIERPTVDAISAVSPYVSKARSTSVGDILKVRDIDPQWTGIYKWSRWWRVENVGFKSIDRPFKGKEARSE